MGSLKGVVLAFLIGLSACTPMEWRTPLDSFCKEQIIAVRPDQQKVGQIWGINPDGSKLEQLSTERNVQKASPRIGPTGEIAFVGLSPEGYNLSGNLYILKKDGNEKQITHTGNILRRGLVWDDLGERIFAIQYQENIKPDFPGGVPPKTGHHDMPDGLANRLVDINVSSGEITPLTLVHMAGSLGDYYKGHVYYSVGLWCYSDIRKISPETKQFSSVADLRLGDNNVRVSPQGDFIVFSSQPEDDHACGRNWFSVAYKKGDEPAEILFKPNFPYFAGNPIISPDGKKVLFATDEPNSSMYKVIDLDTREIKDLSIEGANDNLDWGVTCLAKQ